MEVPSARTVLTALFGMGRGVTQSQESPEFWSQKIAIGQPALLRKALLAGLFSISRVVQNYYQQLSNS